MIKPLRVQELMARVTALMRRAYPDVTTMRLDFEPYRLDPVARTVYLHDQPIELKHREYELAEFLFQNCGRLLSRNHLTEAVWGSITPTPSRTLDTHASRLRTKLQLGQFHGSGRFTSSVPFTDWATGWKFCPPRKKSRRLSEYPARAVYCRNRCTPTLYRCMPTT